MTELTLSELDLDAELAEALPQRDVLAFLNFNSIVASNAAVSANVFTWNSVAVAGAKQVIITNQR